MSQFTSTIVSDSNSNVFSNTPGSSMNIKLSSLGTNTGNSPFGAGFNKQPSPPVLGARPPPLGFGPTPPPLGPVRKAPPLVLGGRPPSSFRTGTPSFGAGTPSAFGTGTPSSFGTSVPSFGAGTPSAFGAGTPSSFGTSVPSFGAGTPSSTQGPPQYSQPGSNIPVPPGTVNPNVPSTNQQPIKPPVVSPAYTTSSPVTVAPRPPPIGQFPLINANKESGPVPQTKELVESILGTPGLTSMRNVIPFRSSVEPVKPEMTEYEMAKIIGLRAEQLARNSPLAIEQPPGVSDVTELATLELYAGMSPMIVVREYPGGRTVKYSVNEMSIPESYIDLVKK